MSKTRLLVLSALFAAGGVNSAQGCERYLAPYFRGAGGFVVEPVAGGLSEVTVEGANESESRAVSAGGDGLAVELLRSPLCAASSGGDPVECRVTFSGIEEGGWYWVNGDRNAAVAPLICEDDLGGGAEALDPGGVETTRSSFGTGTLFVHDTQGLMGIVPQLSQGGDSPTCERHVAPFFRGRGGFVAKPADGQSLEVRIERDSAAVRETLFPRSDGLVVQLLSQSLCVDAAGSPVECRVSFADIGPGGWYWVNGDRNAAVAPLICEGRLQGGAAALDPGGVQTARSVYGTGSLFVHDTQGLMGIVPHLAAGRECTDQSTVALSHDAYFGDHGVVGEWDGTPFRVDMVRNFPDFVTDSDLRQFLAPIGRLADQIEARLGYRILEMGELIDVPSSAPVGWDQEFSRFSESHQLRERGQILVFYMNDDNPQDWDGRGGSIMSAHACCGTMSYNKRAMGSWWTGDDPCCQGNANRRGGEVIVHELFHLLGFKHAVDQPDLVGIEMSSGALDLPWESGSQVFYATTGDVDNLGCVFPEGG